MTATEPTQPLTGFELDNIEGRWSRYVALRDPDSMETSVHDVPDLLAEVDRLRTENTELRRSVAFAAAVVSGDAAEMLPETIAKLRAENAAQASKLAHFEAQHQPVTFDWSASPKCKASHGPAWVNWPCPDAFALGMRSKDYNE